MFNWQSLKVLIPLLLITGCSSVPVAVDIDPFHPPLPEPYATCEHVEWEYIIIGDRARPSLSYQHGLDLSLCRDDLIRYLKQSNNIIEYYRNEKP